MKKTYQEQKRDHELRHAAEEIARKTTLKADFVCDLISTSLLAPSLLYQIVMRKYVQATEFGKDPERVLIEYFTPRKAKP